MIPFNNLSYPWNTPYRVLRNSTGAVIEVDAPGLNREKINVDINGRRLNVRGERELNKDGRSVRLKLNESFILETNVDLDKISTSYVDGIVRVTCPFVENYTRTVQVQ
jgi:HSP20 family protein